MILSGIHRLFLKVHDSEQRRVTAIKNKMNKETVIQPL